ncbi:MAG: hypothetical protein Harvfovirus58_9 [Harvfovirus sp.]|uniref:Uncharacterized protein n=1 Tax=Harvfovirus sp. TaxID=2487768 RepID=A0A3G5A680_9VIRU|nr:MAG: hypothetical protein Harvfovirus58_9 [Harvfovirus sp.]
MPTFKIANPKIIGEFDDTVNAPNIMEAADKAWVKMSAHITNNVPRFLFTLEDTQSGKMHNFEVDEIPQGKLANYSITELSEHKISASQERALKAEEKKLQEKLKNLDGGRHKHRYKDIKRINEDDSSSSSSSEEDLYRKIRHIRNLNAPQPIVYWWYTPLLYQDYNYPSLYMPTFNAPLVPYVEISLSSAFLR